MAPNSLDTAPHKRHYALLLRLGMWPSVLIITTGSVLASIVLTSGFMWLSGVRDEAWPTIIAASIAVPLCVASVVGIVMMRMLLQLDAARRLVQEMAVTDGLTGICNRRHFMDLAGAEFLKAGHEDLPLSVMMVDADHFKTINDRYGHASGDEVLRSIPQVAKDCVRRADVLARYGGEEFVVLLPLTGAGDAAEVAERLRAAVEALHIPATDGAVLRVTVSVGVATRQPQTPSLSALLKAADEALYRAKAAGRNRVESGDAVAAG